MSPRRAHVRCGSSGNKLNPPRCRHFWRRRANLPEPQPGTAPDCVRCTTDRSVGNATIVGLSSLSIWEGAIRAGSLRPASTAREEMMAKEAGGFEVPREMRNLAEQSVQQARQAFDSFISAAQKAATNIEGQASVAQASAR